jgi:heat shock protein HslJ
MKSFIKTNLLLLFISPLLLTAQNINDIQFTEWKLEKRLSVKSQRAARPDVYDCYISFKDSSVTYNMGCNSCSAIYTLNGDSLVINSKGGCTRRACREKNYKAFSYLGVYKYELTTFSLKLISEKYVFTFKRK